MRGAANLADQKYKSEQANDKQPRRASHGDNNASGDDRAHDEPN